MTAMDVHTVVPAIDPAACAGTAQDDPGRDRGDPSSLGGGRSAPA